MKQMLRNLISQQGFELLRRTDDPILARLRTLHEKLRLAPQETVRHDTWLPQPAAYAHLRHLLQFHSIDLIIDVGANRGQFARLTRELGYSGEIFSFEPQLRYREELHHAAAADDRWQFMPYAVGDVPGELELHVFQDDEFSSLHAINQAGESTFGTLVAEDHVEQVPVRTLDSLWMEISGGKTHSVLLKTDTQGHDLAVLSGATTVFPSVQAVLTEAAFLPIYDNAPLFVDVAQWLRSRGFVPSGLFPISHRPTDLALIEIDAFFTRAIA